MQTYEVRKHIQQCSKESSKEKELDVSGCRIRIMNREEFLEESTGLASSAYAGALYGESAVLSCRTVRKLHSGNFSDSGTEKSLGEAIWLRFLYDGAGIDSD